jgi:hypothetical protein
LGAKNTARKPTNNCNKQLSITESGLEARRSAWEIYLRTLQAELAARITLKNPNDWFGAGQIIIVRLGIGPKFQLEPSGRFFLTD